MKTTYKARTGHERYRNTKASNNSAASGRRERAKKRLENQLLTGFKTVSDESGNISTTPLTDADKVRIKKEIETLQARL